MDILEVITYLGIIYLIFVILMLILIGILIVYTWRMIFKKEKDFDLEKKEIESKFKRYDLWLKWKYIFQKVMLK